jgi:hypothetical protein
MDKMVDMNRGKMLGPAFFLFIAIVFFGATSLVLFLPYHLLVYYAGRGNLFESQQTLCSFVAAVLFFIQYLRARDGNSPGLFGMKRNIFFLLMAAGTFFVCGETVSWGQRLLYFSSSAKMVHVNLQAETNIHNLGIFKKYHFLNMEFLFPKVLLVYFLLVPLLIRFSGTFSRFFKKIHLPVVPLSFGIVFLAIPLKFRMVNWDQSSILRQSYMQLKQSDIIFFVMIAACWFLFSKKEQAKNKS